MPVFAGHGAWQTIRREDYSSCGDRHSGRIRLRTSLRLQSLSFRFFNHVKCNLRSRERPKPREVLSGAGTHVSTPREYPIRRVISASEGHERASPLVHGDYVRRIGFRFRRRGCVCSIRLRCRGATMKESRRNTGDNNDQNGSHASSPV